MVENEQYDVFLSHNSADKPTVETLATTWLEASLTSSWPDRCNLVSCVLARDRQIPTSCGKISALDGDLASPLSR